jgi:hypothetical protein
MDHLVIIALQAIMDHRQGRRQETTDHPQATPRNMVPNIIITTTVHLVALRQALGPMAMGEPKEATDTR